MILFSKVNNFPHNITQVNIIFQENRNKIMSLLPSKAACQLLDSFFHPPWELLFLYHPYLGVLHDLTFECIHLRISTIKWEKEINKHQENSRNSYCAKYNCTVSDMMYKNYQRRVIKVIKELSQIDFISHTYHETTI